MTAPRMNPDPEPEVALATGVRVLQACRDLFTALIVLGHEFRVNDHTERVWISDADRLTPNQCIMLNTNTADFYELAREHEWLQQHAH